MECQAEASCLAGDVPAVKASAPLLEIRDLRLQFKSMRGVVKALEGVSLHIDQGEIVGRVGESGCGKTVTSLAAMGLLRGPRVDTTGEVLFRGRDLLACTQQEMRGLRGAEISMVFQDPLASLNPVFTVRQQLSDVVRLHTGVSRDEALERIERSLKAVGLASDARTLNAYPHELSGGMRQRVCLAMALVCGSSLLIADEPTTALDVTIQGQILRLLLDLRERLGVAQLLITHNVGVAAQTCDRVCVMYAGNVVEDGPTREVLINPRHPYTRALIACLPEHDSVRDLQTIPGVVPDLIDPPSGCRFHPRCSQARPECTRERPTPVDVGEGHHVACHVDAESAPPCSKADQRTEDS